MGLPEVTKEPLRTLMLMDPAKGTGEIAGEVHGVVMPGKNNEVFPQTLKRKRYTFSLEV